MIIMAFQESFHSIKTLVDDFKSNEKQYLNPNYSEADVRNDFINKFFIALVWDVRQETQKNPYEQEVRVEKPVLIAKAQKRADYTFYLSPNFRDIKFFVEAKKPSHDLVNKDYFFQTVRYGWNANTPIAVLTDFEEFIILDCRFRPNINDIFNYKIKSFHYSDYANEETFKEIYYLFSHEVVSDNAIEKFADNLPKPMGIHAFGKGKAVKRGLFKGGFQSIDESFLEELDEIRTSLAKSFKKNNSHLSSEELTEATQRTIDRLVFIKFLEDKMIEPHNYVSEFGKRRSAWEDFITASRTLDAKYNGAVFKKVTIDSRNIVEPDDKTFSSICEELSHENSPYNFDAIPIHILGSIYERFLGKVVNATDKRVTIDDKPEVRKAGGVYYTPQYIVDYIVNNTVVKLIAGLPGGKAGKTPKEIAKMRFADIACGSGSFLITVYERLIDYHKKWYQQNPEQAKKDGCIFYEGAYRLSLQQKQKILLNNIYGVDLDQQAVEVTQLSLYLKLLEDETTATANDTWVMFKEKLLPDLNKNIINGNSLIGTDIIDGNLFSYEEEKKLKPMNFEDVFPEVIRNGGFDAIVGNPPYRMMQPHNTEQIILKYFIEKFNIAEFKIDLFHLFIQQSINKLRNNGLLGYITPSSLLNNVYVENLRLWILENCRINKISLTKEKVFKDADVYTSVFIFEKEKDKTKRNNHIIFKTDRLELYKHNKELNYSKIKQARYYESIGKVWNLLIDESNIGIINKMNNSGQPLDKVSQLNRGLITGNRDKYFSNEKVNDKYAPILSGSDVFRYFSNDISEYVLFKKPKTAGGCWDIEVHLAEHKVLIRQIGVQPTATLITSPLAVTGNIFTIITGDLTSEKYILGLINSKAVYFYWKLMFTDFKNSFPQVTIFSLGQIPIPNWNNNSDKKIDLLVDQILMSKRQLHEAKTESDKTYLERKCYSIDKQIDELVYQLYGLTEEEIKIVEGE